MIETVLYHSAYRPRSRSVSQPHRPGLAPGGAHVSSSPRQVQALASPCIRGRFARRWHIAAGRARVRWCRQALLVAKSQERYGRRPPKSARHSRDPDCQPMMELAGRHCRSRRQPQHIQAPPERSAWLWLERRRRAHAPGDPYLRPELPLACTGRKVRFGSSGWSETKEHGMGDPAGDGGAPGGGGTERKLVTVLAVDLDEPVEGFDERDPEDVRAMLAGHLDRVRAEVEGFGGSIEHAAAGRALAVFGV